MAAQIERRPLFDPPIVRQALSEALKKLHPWHQVRNPVMFVVLVGSVLTTGLFMQALVGWGEAPAGFIFAVSLWLWFTVLFANFTEAMAEGRGKAQAAALRRARREVMAKHLAYPRYGAAHTSVSASGSDVAGHFDPAYRAALPAGRDGPGPGAFSVAGQRQSHHAERTARRLGPHWAAL
jgi:high-affinity K+ transport system ATPase subunit B